MQMPTWERLRSSRMREYKQVVWEMRKIREQLGKQERGRKINYIIASPSLASLWSYPTETVLSNKIARNRIVLSF